MTLSVNEQEFAFEQKYRPRTLDEMVLPAADKKIFKTIAKSKKIPHLILESASPGTGKTTLAETLCLEADNEYMMVNGSNCTLNFLRGPIAEFASAGSLGGRHKVVIIDEFDRGSLTESQKHLRSMMEAYSFNCSFVITCNDISKIIDPLKSRCRVVKFGKASEEEKVTMMKEMIRRCAEICKTENLVVEDMTVLAALVKKNFPDFRKTVGELDWYSKHGKIDAGILSIVTQKTTIDTVIEAIKEKKVKELRNLAPQYAGNYSDFIQSLTSSLYGMLDSSSIVRMYQIVGESNQYYGMAANAEIHIFYMLLQLTMELTWK
ncbi:sliding clamp loader subunit [Serratia phage Muldoon]|uniref:Sliding-clamp-loader large subunit n=1 Tax=Serratia phage Muldoon TaxID=2601678 RepID=A0A5P8PH30_9CAUD|nr:sliding clamp loader subunit [Serratia phage Muldoon]QFR56007.1 sliding clamp loader subunit [Serratia phage Muldoon]